MGMRPMILGDRRGPASPPRQRPLKQRSIRSQQKLKTDKDYIPKSAQIKLELSVEKGTKEVKAFQALQEKHSQVLIECQLKLKSLVIEAGDLDLIEKVSVPPFPSWSQSTTSPKDSSPMTTVKTSLPISALWTSSSCTSTISLYI